MAIEHQFLPDDAHLRAIGIVAVRWGFLESVVDEAIHHLLEVDKAKAHVVTDNILSMATRLDVLKTLLKPKLDTDL